MIHQYWLVLWNMWIIFSIYWECHHPNWRTHIFQRGRSTTNQSRFRSNYHTIYHIFRQNQEMDDVLGSVSWIPTDVLKWMAQRNGWLIEFGPLKQLQACNTNLPPPTMQATLFQFRIIQHSFAAPCQMRYILVGGLEHDFYIFPSYWEQ